jgi:hypothetical protein
MQILVIRHHQRCLEFRDDKFFESLAPLGQREFLQLLDR